MAKLLNPITFKEFDGLRNTTAPERLSPADLQVAVNVDIDDSKRITRRTGRTSRLAGGMHSLWSDGAICLAVQGTTLCRINAEGASTYSKSVLRTGLTAGARMSFWSVAGVVYYANGFEKGVIQGGRHRSWGLDWPSGQPVASPIGGGLPAGRYQYALTFLREDGQESGTGLAGTIDLTEPGGIRFSSIPVSADPTVRQKALYLTATNGEILYRALVIDNADVAARYEGNALDLKMTLKTQFGMPPPAGHLVGYYRGHMLVAEGAALWNSEPYRHELFMLRKAFRVFPSDINLVAPVEDGVFIGADKTYFLSGASPDKWTLTTVAGYPAIPGTMSYVPAEGGEVGEGLPGRAIYWASPRGHCMGTNGGTFRNLTEARYSYPGAQRGAGIVRPLKGMHQYLAVLEGAGSAHNAYS